MTNNYSESNTLRIKIFFKKVLTDGLSRYILQINTLRVKIFEIQNF